MQEEAIDPPTAIRAAPLDDGSVRRLDPARIPAERWGALISMAFLLLPLGALGAWIWWYSSWDPALRLGIGLGCVLLYLLVGGLLLLWPSLEHKRTEWRLDREGLEIRRGVIWRHVISVPRRRIQHTDVAQGPLQRRYGLGTLITHTAGTHSYEIRLEGIAHGLALRVRDSLLEEMHDPSAQSHPEPLETDPIGSLDGE